MHACVCGWVGGCACAFAHTHRRWRAPRPCALPPSPGLTASTTNLPPHLPPSPVPRVHCAARCAACAPLLAAPPARHAALAGATPSCAPARACMCVLWVVHATAHQHVCACTGGGAGNRCPQQAHLSAAMRTRRCGESPARTSSLMSAMTASQAASGEPLQCSSTLGRGQAAAWARDPACCQAACAAARMLMWACMKGLVAYLECASRRASVQHRGVATAFVLHQPLA